MSFENPLRIAVYIDGFNLYFGGKVLVPDGSWKWLDVRKLIESHLPKFAPWNNYEITRVLYFTAEVTDSPETLRRQQAYRQALRISGSVDYVIFGKFKSYKDENYAVTGYYTKYKKVNMPKDPLPDEPWVRIDAENYIRVSH